MITPKRGNTSYLEKEIPHREILAKQSGRLETKAENLHINIIKGDADCCTGCFFRKVPPQKVLSVEDGKIPTKKVKVRVKT